jgi:hypothetical protein
MFADVRRCGYAASRSAALHAPGAGQSQHVACLGFPGAQNHGLKSNHILNQATYIGPIGNFVLEYCCQMAILKSR